jgi:hypothetical protein
MAIAVQGEADRGVPRAHSDLLGRRAGGDLQRRGRVAKVVDAQALQASCLGIRRPRARPKARDPQRPQPGGGEDVTAGPLRGGKMRLELTDDKGRQPDSSAAGTRLGRAGDQLALDLGEGLATVTAPASRRRLLAA